MADNLNNPNNRKREEPGRFGTDITHTEKLLTDFTANTTVYNTMPTPATKVSYLERLSVSIGAAALDSDGTVLLKVQKVRGGSGGTVTDLTNTLSIEADVVTVQPATYRFTFVTGLTPGDFTFLGPTTNALLYGDVLRVAKINNSAAIDTQAVDCHVVAEWAAGN